MTIGIQIDEHGTLVHREINGQSDVGMSYNKHDRLKSQLEWVSNAYKQAKTRIELMPSVETAESVTQELQDTNRYLAKLIPDILDVLNQRKLQQEALAETMKRYPDAKDALAWFGSASGLFEGTISQETLNWVNDVVLKREGTDNEKGNIVL